MSVLLLAGVLAAAAAVSGEPTAHVFLIIGQSNAVGSNYDGHNSEDVAYPNIWQASCCRPDLSCDLRPAQDPLHHFCDPTFLNSSNIGFGMSFARALRAEVPEDDLIVLVPSAIGGTGFNDGTWTANEGPGFKEAVRRTTLTLTLVQLWCQVCTVNFAGMLWHQGENDATETADTYLNKDLIPLINALRNNSVIPGSSSQVPFVVGNLVPAWLAADASRSGVLSAVQLLPQYVQRTGTAPSFGLQPDKQDPLYPVHFNAASQRVLGKRYYAAYKEALLNDNLV